MSEPANRQSHQHAHQHARQHTHPRIDRSTAILDAASDLFAREGIANPAMAQIALAAGCSRATLYRYFPTRRALHAAFAEREARTVLDSVVAATAGLAARERAVAGVLACLAEVRARDHLRAWYASDGGAELLAVLTDPAVSARIAPDVDPLLVSGVVRLVVSLLVCPDADEAGLIERLLGRAPSVPEVFRITAR